MTKKLRHSAVSLAITIAAVVSTQTAGTGPEKRSGTLEDIYGDTGNTFQAAIGFINFEGTPSSIAQQSYGLAIDDLVVKWREFTLEADSTDCDENGSCAVVELATSITFESQTVLTLAVLDPVPDPENYRLVLHNGSCRWTHKLKQWSTLLNFRTDRRGETSPQWR